MTRQIYKGETLSRTVVKNNILRIWNITNEDERRDWYMEALDFATELSGEVSSKNPLNKVCGVIAALSPVKRWEQNMTCATDMILTGDCGHMTAFKKKAADILTSDGTDESILGILNGNKISAFYLNIRYPKDVSNVTIDRHALSVALGKWITDEDYQGMTNKQYGFFVHCYNKAASQAGVSSILMQSATWVKFRKIKTQY